MIAQFRLPDLGEGLADAEIVQWLVAVGDTVALNQTIAEVETAKAVVELPSPHAGVVHALHAGEGDVVPVGAPLLSFEVDAPDAAVPTLVGYGAAPVATARPHRRPRVGRGPEAIDVAVRDAAPHDAVPLPAPPDDDRLHERLRSTPPVRKLAKDLGVDLSLVAASGAPEPITRAEVEAFVARAGSSSAGSLSAPGRDAATRTTRIPVRGVRRATADAMVRSAFTAPQATVFLTVDVTATVELVASLRADPALGDHGIGLLAVVARAVCLALHRHPMLNARWEDDADEIVEHHYVDLGIAAATPRGLIVPRIPDADRLGLAELADAVRELATAARAGRTAASALSGSTFTITNVGVFGVDGGTPILNPGEAGILAVGAVQRRPWENRGEVALRDVVQLSLSFDHRLVDGEHAARFLTDVAAVLREPGRALLSV